MRLAISIPYVKLRDYSLAGNPMSPRKNICLLFLRWAQSGKVEDKDNFLKALKEWRKIEGRIGGHRTLLERKGRRIARQNWNRERHASTRKAAREWGLKAKELKIGILSPEWQERNSEFAIKGAQMRKEQGLPHNNCKKWVVHSPEGEVFYLLGLAAFCREKGLDRRTLYATRWKEGKTHKGWWVEPDDSNWREF